MLKAIYFDAYLRILIECDDISHYLSNTPLKSIDFEELAKRFSLLAVKCQAIDCPTTYLKLANKTIEELIEQEESLNIADC